jgi:acyl carrier protein phosphodiesterase
MSSSSAAYRRDLSNRTNRYVRALAMRLRILTRRVRSVTLDCLRQHFRTHNWDLYCTAFRWNMASGRWKYLLGFPPKALISQE